MAPVVDGQAAGVHAQVPRLEGLDGFSLPSTQGVGQSQRTLVSSKSLHHHQRQIVAETLPGGEDPGRCDQFSNNFSGRLVFDLTCRVG